MSSVGDEKTVIKLTEGQQMAVEIRDANVLVAAAAGSGKTKVLVDRILGKVTDENSSVNVDDFLVVTFTNAAASQMRDKIRDKLSEALEANPENEHLKLQQLLINRADICTIDSFCLKLVKENFNLLDIDSSFSIGDPGMMELVKSEVMDRLFEELYDGGDESFKILVDIFDSKNKEEDLRKAVSDVYYKASSYPVPDKWLDEAKKCLQIECESDIDSIPWVKYYMDIAHSELICCKEKAMEIVKLAQLPGGPEKYLSAVENDLESIDRLLAAQTYEQLYEAAPSAWTRLSGGKKNESDPELLEKAKKLREGYKKQIKEKIAPKKSGAQLLDEIKHIATYLIPLIELVQRFMDEYMSEKKTRRMLEFSDIEHMAHALVCKGYDENGRPIPTELAKNISSGIEEIYIDEYQDSNFLQEDILSCVSGTHRGDNNMFMVGDVKQSIYRFRMARPDLFISKFNSFSSEGTDVKILLNNNFRSRASVLLPINYLFYQLMGDDLGGITYDSSVSLIPTMSFPEPGEEIKSRVGGATEIMVLNLEQTEEEEYESDNPQEILDEDMENAENLELEAHMIAGRIKQLINKDTGMLVLDEKTKSYRNACYGDVVILVRSMKNVGEKLYNVLSSYGIPVYVSDPKGYFDAVEVRVVMSMLSVIDNARQDIPLAAVLMSPIGGLDESELAIICDYSKLKDIEYLYHRCQLYMMDHNNSISKKLSKFFELLDILKTMKNQVSISQLIWEVLERTDYYAYVSAMPMGHRRRANLDMLLEKADAYEDGYYKGLFNFLKYVEKLKVNQVDFGEAADFSDDEDVVRIMTMHASKGLEYPIVFVSALGKQFNTSEYKDKLIINSDYYLAMTYMDRNKRYSKETFIREAFKEINMSESMAEELRVLYVALTRAKEKLIMTGHTKKWTSLLDKLSSVECHRDILLSYDIRKKSKCFIDMILAAMVRYKDLAETYNVEDMLELNVITKEDLANSLSRIRGDEDMEGIDMVAELKREVDKHALQEVADTFSYGYPYEEYVHLKGKMTVSDIKKLKAYDGAGYDDSEFEYTQLKGETFEDQETIEEMEIKDTSKSATKTKKKLDGAARGTIVHKAMELVDFAALVENRGEGLYQYARNHKKWLGEQGIFDMDELKAINCRKIANMLKSQLGQRMIKAAARGELYKEQQFSMGFLAKDVFDISTDVETDDTIIVQGIVDGYFVEGGEIVVMDYKTDACDEETLVGRYKAQLNYYADTLSKLRGLPVKEKIMYSFSMEKEVPV